MDIKLLFIPILRTSQYTSFNAGAIQYHSTCLIPQFCVERAILLHVWQTASEHVGFNHFIPAQEAK